MLEIDREYRSSIELTAVCVGNVPAGDLQPLSIRY